MNALQQVLSRQGQPIVIGNDIDDELSNSCKKFITVPHTVDCLQGFVVILLMT